MEKMRFSVSRLISVLALRLDPTGLSNLIEHGDPMFWCAWRGLMTAAALNRAWPIQIGKIDGRMRPIGKKTKFTG